MRIKLLHKQRSGANGLISELRPELQFIVATLRSYDGQDVIAGVISSFRPRTRA